MFVIIIAIVSSSEANTCNKLISDPERQGISDCEHYYPCPCLGETGTYQKNVSPHKTQLLTGPLIQLDLTEWSTYEKRFLVRIVKMAVCKIDTQNGRIIEEESVEGIVGMVL